MAVKKKKNSSKKAATTKTSAKKSAPKKMVVAGGEHCFWVNNGPVLRSLKDLEMALPKMNDAQWGYHVNGTRNDFASWVEFVLLDSICAKDLKGCKTRSAARTCVARAVKKYR